MIQRFWLNEKIRYLLIGAYNTAFGYGVFATLWVMFGNSLHYILILTISHIISVTSAFFLYRILVFRKQGNAAGDFIRFNMVYLGTFLFNIIALPTLIEVGSVHPLAAQAFILGLTIISSYILHRRFSFKLK